MENRCPVCKRYVGLWLRGSDKPIACELHQHKRSDEKWNMVNTYGHTFFIKEDRHGK
jgi:hypothetical protein